VNAAVLSEGVSLGLADLEEVFSGRVRHEPDGEGGAYVVVEGIELGPNWSATSAELAFHLAYNFPASSIYPYYLQSDVVPAGGAFPQALQRVEWRGSPMIQVSLRQERWDPRRDNAVGAVMQTQDWLRSR
jgi:hypothetical protein